MKSVFFLSILFLVFSFQGKGQVKINKSADYVDDIGSLGAQNAIKKAHQMTDLEFVPLSAIIANHKKTYQANKKYKGLIYSSVKETNTFVGLDVSFHTFMTALHNPRSVLYTIDVGKAPYHGKNAGAYYGAVCSSFVSYALGFDINQKSYDIPDASFMMLVEDQSVKGIRLADVLWKKGHVALITGIRRKKDSGEIVKIEISEASVKGCRRREKDSEEDFNAMLREGEWKIYRYKNLEKNQYKPLTEFVAVEGERKSTFQYNDEICPNKGDKSCYITGEDVVLNIIEGYSKVEIYKDSELFKTIRYGDNLDIILKDLPYGDYRARLKKWWKSSDFTYWKVVDVNVKADVEKQRVLFNSGNATPVYMEFCSIAGDRPKWGVQVLTEKDLAKGFVQIGSLQQKKIKNKESNIYIKVHFECDYGRVVNKPLLWKKRSNNENNNIDDTIEDTFE